MSAYIKHLLSSKLRKLYQNMTLASFGMQNVSNFTVVAKSKMIKYV